MTRLPTSASARARRRAARRLVAAGAGLAVAAGLLAAPAGADPLADQIASAQAQASALEAQIQAAGQHLEVLGQQYDAAQAQTAQLRSQAQATEARLAATRRRAAAARRQLQEAAVQAYMQGPSTASIVPFLQPTSDAAALAEQYRSVADDNLQGALDTLHRAQAQEASLEQSQATQAAQLAQQTAQLAADRQAASQAQTAQQALLAQVQGQVATLIAQQQAQEQAAQQALFAALAAHQQAAAQADAGPAAPGGATNLPVAPGGAGAVQAAETQLGVPYVWGGESPGVGFDCSGLTQWAWAQAGVSLPRTAQEQYDAIAHVALSDLEPGDLLFWNDGTSSVQHVAMYVGNGTVIQAPYTGAVVSFSAIWTDGLVGAGRP